MKVNSVITLDDKFKCLLLDKTNFENSNYYLAVALDENNQPIEDYAVLKESIENNEIYVEKEEDTNVLSQLLVTFTKNFNRLVDELNNQN